MKTIISNIWIAYALVCGIATVAPIQAFQPPAAAAFGFCFSTSTAQTAVRGPAAKKANLSNNNSRFSHRLFVVKKDKQQGVSSSGYRQDRLNKLAELESERVETDKGFVLKAAGGFVGLIVILLVAAFASGILYQV